MTDFMEKTLQKIGLTPTKEQLDALNRYYELLVETNKVMNLTAITEYEDVVVKHFADSLAIHRVCDLTKVHTILDVGTGAGFPGMVLKIMFPSLQLTLLDSLNKRILFLKKVAEELSLTGITFLHGRAEDYAQMKEHREQYDLVVSRAVANLSTLSEYCLPYVALGHSFISYKAGDCAQEVSDAAKAIHVLGGKVAQNVSFVLPDTDISRCFIEIQKSGKTPSKYPRKAGLPSKEPIS